MTIENNQTLFSLENSKLQEEYYQLLINRITHSSMSLEIDLGDLNNHDNAVRLKDNMVAFKLLMNNTSEKLSEDLIIKIANQVNVSSMYISDGYRKLGDFIAGTNIAITPPEKISAAISALIKRYYTEYQELDVYEREARFHIEFIKIHPFEDGNGRTSRLFLIYNLLKQNIAPVIITADLIEYYQSYIKSNDIEGMANLFRIQSKREQEVINKLLEENTKQTENKKSSSKR